MSKLISFETAKLAAEMGIIINDIVRVPRVYLSDYLRENHKMFISITPVVINTPDDITFKGTIMYFKDCWRLAPALNNTDYDKLYEELLYKALTLIKSV